MMQLINDVLDGAPVPEGWHAMRWEDVSAEAKRVDALLIATIKTCAHALGVPVRDPADAIPMDWDHCTCDSADDGACGLCDPHTGPGFARVYAKGQRSDWRLGAPYRRPNVYRFRSGLG
jgi:hypothetical protein